MNSDDEQARKAKALSGSEREFQLIDAGSAVPLTPLAGYSTATLSATGALLTIEYLLPPPATQTAVLRLGMTRAQCTELGDALKRLAVLPYKSQSQPS